MKSKQMSPVRGNMQLLAVLLVLALTEAKRRPANSLKQERDYTSRHSGRGVDTYPARFQGSVDFGHVYKDGFGELNVKQNFDLSNLAEPRNLEEAKELLRQYGIKIERQKKVEEPLGFANPRDAIQYSRQNLKMHRDFMVDKSVDRTFHKPEVVNNARKDANKPVQDTITKHPTHVERGQAENIYENGNHNTRKYFARDGFGLVSEEAQYGGNWTTCNEFAKGAVFHPDDIINIPWLPFYIWSVRQFTTSFIHTFSYPTKKLVRKYKETIGPYLDLKVDWEQPKLLLKESKDMLMIAGDRRGLFYGLPSVELPDSFKALNVTVPVIIVRLKIIDPYIAMMYCNDNYAIIMTVVGTEPETDEQKTAEAAILKFVGVGKPASRDLEREALQEQYEKEKKRKEEAMKHFEERPINTVDASLW